MRSGWQSRSGRGLVGTILIGGLAVLMACGEADQSHDNLNQQIQALATSSDPS